VSTYEIPLRPEAQTFLVELSGVSYRLSTYWCTEALHWVLNIQEPAGALIAGGLPLVPGADLTEQLKYLSIPGKLFVQTEGEVTKIPTYTGLGNESKLYYVSDLP
jgi:hypothetical protein